MFQMREQSKTAEKELNKMETGNIPGKELKVMVRKMLPRFKTGWIQWELKQREKKLKKKKNQSWKIQ